MGGREPWVAASRASCAEAGPGSQSGCLEQSSALYQMGVGGLLASCTWVQILQVICSASIY